MIRYIIISTFADACLPVVCKDDKDVEKSIADIRRQGGDWTLFEVIRGEHDIVSQRSVCFDKDGKTIRSIQ
jgi:uncharacterized protein with GYD domain